MLSLSSKLYYLYRMNKNYTLNEKWFVKIQGGVHPPPNFTKGGVMDCHPPPLETAYVSEYVVLKPFRVCSSNIFQSI